MSDVCRTCQGRNTITNDPFHDDSAPYTCPMCGGSGLRADELDYENWMKENPDV